MADLPPQRTTTGSAVINMSRQIGAMLGTSVLVLLLGTVVATAQVRTTTSDMLATDLLAIANDAQADLLVLGRHHHTRLSALFERPVEEDIIKDVSLPVLLVPSAPQ